MSRTGLLLMLLLVLAASTALPGEDSQPPRVTMSFADQPVMAVLEGLAAAYHAGLAVDGRETGRLGRPVTMTFTACSWSDVVAIFSMTRNLQLDLRDGWLHVTAPVRDADWLARLRMRVIPCAAVTHELPGRQALLLFAGGSGLAGSGGGLLPPLQAEWKPEINETIELVQKLVSPEAWGNDGVAIQEYNGDMVVTHHPAVLDQVDQLVSGLTRRSARQIVCRLYHADGAAAGADRDAVVDAQRWRELAAAGPRLAATFLTHDCQQQSHTALNVRPYLAAIAVKDGCREPRVALLRTGLSLDVLPKVTLMGVTATIRLCASTLLRIEQAPVSTAAGVPIASIATPIAATDSIATTVDIPAGGAAILRFDDHAYALAFEVLSYDDGTTLGPFLVPPGVPTPGPQQPAQPLLTVPTPPDF